MAVREGLSNPRRLATDGRAFTVYRGVCVLPVREENTPGAAGRVVLGRLNVLSGICLSNDQCLDSEIASWGGLVFVR